MIIKASTRGSPNALARHLLNERDNEHIEIHEVRGFLADDVAGAMRETEAISKGIKSRKPLFSVSLSPPEQENVGVDIFEAAIAEIEQRNGLGDQPRIILFHEKEGRRHAHAVWSRIDADHMRVIALPFYKQRVNEIAKNIYLEQGWKLPPGFIDRKDRSPTSYDLALYQQAKREGRDPERLKRLAQEAWALSQDRKSFEAELERRGLYLARGDRRAHVVMGIHGEPMSLPRLLGRKTREVTGRLGKPDEHRDIEATRSYIADRVTPALQRMLGEADQLHARRMEPLDRERLLMRDAHASERRRMDAGLAARWEAETQERAARLRRGLAGLLDRITGRAAQVRDENAREAYDALRRDRAQRQAMLDAQLGERRLLQSRIRDTREDHQQRIDELHSDLGRHLEADRTPQRTERAEWLEASRDRHRLPEPQPDHAPKREPVSARVAWLEAQKRGHAPERSPEGPGFDPDRGYDRGYDFE